MKCEPEIVQGTRSKTDSRGHHAGLTNRGLEFPSSQKHVIFTARLYIESNYNKSVPFCSCLIMKICYLVWLYCTTSLISQYFLIKYEFVYQHMCRIFFVENYFFLRNTASAPVKYQR